MRSTILSLLLSISLSLASDIDSVSPGSERQPKLFYVSSSTTTTTVSTITFCYHILSTNKAVYNCGRKKRSVSDVREIEDGAVIQPTSSEGKVTQEIEALESGQKRDPKYLNYWMTTTTTLTS